MQHRAMDILEQARLQNIGMIEAIRRDSAEILTVEGDALTYQPLKGKAEVYQAKAVGRIDIVQSPRCEEMRFYNRSGKKLFEIQGYMINSQALRKYMRKYPVKISKIDDDKK